MWGGGKVSQPKQVLAGLGDLMASVWRDWWLETGEVGGVDVDDMGDFAAFFVPVETEADCEDVVDCEADIVGAEGLELGAAAGWFVEQSDGLEIRGSAIARQEFAE